ncbi:MAG: PadR family transcriptional regulator [Moorellales bacterium]
MQYDSRDYWTGLIRMCLSRFFILHALHLAPLHGYEITKRVAAFTQGCCAPTEGSLYPLLREFVQAGVVTVKREVVAGRERKVYTLTPLGERVYRIAAQVWAEAAGYVLQAVGDGGSPLRAEDGCHKASEEEKAAGQEVT